MEIVKKIQDILRVKYLKQSELADQIGISKQSMSAIMNGKSQPSAKTLNSLFKRYGINANWFFHDKGNMFLSEEKEGLESTSEAFLKEKETIIDLQKDKIDLLEEKIESYDIGKKNT